MELVDMPPSKCGVLDGVGVRVPLKLQTVKRFIMNITEIFLLFLKKELSPNERKAFVNTLKKDFYVNMLRSYIWKDNRVRKNYIAFKVFQGLRTGFYSYCSSLSSLMHAILYSYFDILGNANMKNPLIESMHYDCGKLGYRKYHIKYYCDKWHNFLRNNVKDYHYSFYFSSALNQNYSLL